MNLHRATEILDQKEKTEIFYEQRPVWIQEIHDNIAKIGFIDKPEEKEVYLEDLYEKNLYE